MSIQMVIDFTERQRRRTEEYDLAVKNDRAIRAVQVAMCKSMSGLELMSHILDFHPDPPNAEPWLDDLARSLWGVGFQQAYHAWHKNVLEGRT